MNQTKDTLDATAINYGRKKVKFNIRPGTNLWEIGFSSGGEVPGPISGLYTSEFDAKLALEVFKANGKK